MASTKCGFDSGAGLSGLELLTERGPTLFVDIGFDKDWPVASKLAPVTGIQQIRALVDTGATESCIDGLVATRIGLPILDRRPISGVGGRHIVNMYLAQIYVPSLSFTIWGAFAGVDLAAGGLVHSALIGRTFLRNFTMVYEGRTGTVTIHND